MVYRCFVPLIFMSVLFACSPKAKIKEKGTLVQSPIRILSERMPASLNGKESLREGTESTWWNLYNMALIYQKEDPQKSCSFFLALSKDHEFPLSHLAFLRSIQTCPKTLKLESVDLKSIPWLKKIREDILIDHYIGLNFKKPAIELLVEKSKRYMIQAEKEELLLQALKLSRQVNDSELTKKVQHRIYKISPRRNPYPRTLDQKLKAAKDFLKARKFRESRALYRKVIKENYRSFDIVLSGLKGIRKSLKVERNLKEHVNVSEKVLKLTKSKYFKSYGSKSKVRRRYSSLYLANGIYHARALWTLGQKAKAITYLEDIQKNLSRHHSMVEVYWLRARMEEESKSHLPALEWISLALDQKRLSKLWKEKLLWRKAWVLRKLERHGEAINVYEELASIADSVVDMYKYKYWMARSLKESGQSTKGNELFTEVSEKDSIGYYGALAHRELNTSMLPLFPESSPPIVKSLESQSADFSSKGTSSLVLLEWLIACNELEVAREYISYLKTKKLWDISTPAKVNYLSRSHLFLEAFALIGGLPDEQRMELQKFTVNSLFPKKYMGLISEASINFEVDMNLIFSIIRQESAFNPLARSPADAFGLMQLLPTTARNHQYRTRYRIKKAQDLYDPKANIQIGASYIRNLWDEFNGQIVLTAASYNANKKVVKNWVKVRFTGDPTVFIEDIPYQETQTYVKLILRNYITYSRLSQSNPMSFPEWCLEGIQIFKS